MVIPLLLGVLNCRQCLALLAQRLRPQILLQSLPQKLLQILLQ